LSAEAGSSQTSGRRRKFSNDGGSLLEVLPVPPSRPPKLYAKVEASATVEACGDGGSHVEGSKGRIDALPGRRSRPVPDGLAKEAALLGSA